MKTPYDVALRLRQREVDEVKLAIGAQNAELARVKAARSGVDATLKREREIVAADPLLNPHGYGARMRAHRQALIGAQQRADARLLELRDEAAAAFGSLRAVESAADDYRVEEARIMANIDQARMDDSAAAAFIRETRMLLHARKRAAV